MGGDRRDSVGIAGGNFGRGLVLGFLEDGFDGGRVGGLDCGYVAD
jgi:hypothetical protein